jgi:hypothetical protein
MSKRPTLPEPVVIPANIVRLVPDEPGFGGWFVVRGKFGWLFGSRREALAGSRELAEEIR